MACPRPHASLRPCPTWMARLSSKPALSAAEAWLPTPLTQLQLWPGGCACLWPREARWAQKDVRSGRGLSPLPAGEGRLSPPFSLPPTTLDFMVPTRSSNDLKVAEFLQREEGDACMRSRQPCCPPKPKGLRVRVTPGETPAEDHFENATSPEKDTLQRAQPKSSKRLPQVRTEVSHARPQQGHKICRPPAGETQTSHGPPTDPSHRPPHMPGREKPRAILFFFFSF